MQAINHVSFIDGGLQANTHYVEIKDDLSDLKDKAMYYLNNTQEAQEIANNGFEKYQDYFESGNELVSDSLFSNIVASWGNAYEEPARPSLAHRLWSKAYTAWIRLSLKA